MKKIIAIITFLGLVVAFPLGAVSSGATTAPIVPDEILFRRHGDTEHFRILRVPQGASFEHFLAGLKGNPTIEYAEPNYTVEAFFVPNDTFYSFQWHMDDTLGGTNPFGGTNGGGINVEPAWDVSTGLGVTVAVLDTGVAYEDFDRFVQAPDLAGTSFVPGYDFINDDTHPNDDNGHGTHVAGTIAQSTHNSLGVAGVAFDAAVMPVKVLNKRGSGSHATVANGIYFAVNNGADVINLSLGSSSPSTTMSDAVSYAYDNGVTVVAAAGNSSTDSLHYPAAYETVIAVGATRYDETLAPYSNFGSWVDLTAPGGDNSVDQNGDGFADGVLQQTFQNRVDKFKYYFFQGTSMATPHVVGVAALVIANGVTGPDNVRAAMETTAEDKGAAGFDSTYGWGIVDAAAALTFTPGPIDNPPSATVTSPLDGAVVEGIAVSITADATDDVGVARVDFSIDGVFLSSDMTSPYEAVWDSTTVGDGSHTIAATAVDTADQTASDSVSVTVDNVNDPPVANAGPDQSVTDSDGDGVEPITLDGSASSDADGSIVSYDWYEGASLIATGVNPTVSLALGDHTITLTATDNGDATDSDTVVITVNEAADETALHVADITMSIKKKGSKFDATALVAVVDAGGIAVSGATVTGDWSGAVSIVGQTSDTNGGGTAKFQSGRNGAGTYIFTVTGISKAGYVYDAVANAETSDSIATP